MRPGKEGGVGEIRVYMSRLKEVTSRRYLEDSKQGKSRVD